MDNNNIISIVKKDGAVKVKNRYIFHLYGKNGEISEYTTHGEGMSMTEGESSYLIFSDNEGNVSDVIPVSSVWRVCIEEKVVPV